jgi:hypothetical protein
MRIYDFMRACLPLTAVFAFAETNPFLVFRVLLMPFGIRGFRRSGFARRGEKIAKSD